MVVKIARTITILTLISSIGCNMLEEPATSTESSSEYLRKVMTELQDFNLPPELSVGHGPAHYDVDEMRYLPGKRYSGGKRLVSQPSNVRDDLSIQASVAQPVVKKIPSIPNDHATSQTGSKHLLYQGHGTVLPSPQKGTETLLKPEVYRHAMETGSAVSLNALASALRYRQLPKIVNHVQAPDTQSMYTYYFHPLKPSVNDVRYGYDLVPAMSLRPESTDLMGDAQKDLSNPLFMAISGFIGMAVLFMIGVLVLPRLGDFRSHVNNDEKLLDLTKTVTQAIDQYNCTDKRAPYTNLDERLRNLCHTVKTSRPSSVVLLTKKSALQKAAQKRRKVLKKCKVSPCKKNPERNGPT